MANRNTYFPHDADAHTDPWVRGVVVARYGHFGYAAWFILLEVYQAYHRRGVLETTVADLSRRMFTKAPRCLEILGFFRDQGRIILETIPDPSRQNPGSSPDSPEHSRESVRIEIPKVLERLRKQLAKTEQKRSEGGGKENKGEKKRNPNIEGEKEDAPTGDQAPQKPAAPPQPPPIDDTTIEAVRTGLEDRLGYAIRWASPSTGNPVATKTTVRRQLELAGGDVADVVARLKAGADFRLRHHGKASSYVSEALAGLSDLRAHEKENARAGVPSTTAPAPSGRPVITGAESMEDLIGE